MTRRPTILVPQGAEHQAVCRGLRAFPHEQPVPLPVGPEPVSAFLQQWCRDSQRSGLLQRKQPVLVMGLCGSLRSELGVGSPVICRACVDVRQSPPAAELACDPAFTTELQECLKPMAKGIALTCDRIIHRSQEKQTLAAHYQADVVDMEGFSALETLQQHGIPVAMLRVVSDDLHHDLPDLSSAISPTGTLQPLPMAMGMFRQPVSAIRLIRGSLRGLQVLEQLTRDLAKSVAASEP